MKISLLISSLIPLVSFANDFSCVGIDSATCTENFIDRIRAGGTIVLVDKEYSLGKINTKPENENKYPIPNNLHITSSNKSARSIINVEHLWLEASQDIKITDIHLKGRNPKYFRGRNETKTLLRLQGSRTLNLDNNTIEESAVDLVSVFEFKNGTIFGNQLKKAGFSGKYKYMAHDKSVRPMGVALGIEDADGLEISLNKIEMVRSGILVSSKNSSTSLSHITIHSNTINNAEYNAYFPATASPINTINKTQYNQYNSKFIKCSNKALINNQSNSLFQQCLEKFSFKETKNYGGSIYIDQRKNFNHFKIFNNEVKGFTIHGIRVNGKHHDVYGNTIDGGKNGRVGIKAHILYNVTIKNNKIKNTENPILLQKLTEYPEGIQSTKVINNIEL